MKPALYASLVEHLQKWVNSNCEENNWPDMYWGNATVECMAKAAAAVVDACEESQAYAIQEGGLQEVK